MRGHRPPPPAAPSWLLVAVQRTARRSLSSQPAPPPPPPPPPLLSNLLYHRDANAALPLDNTLMERHVAAPWARGETMLGSGAGRINSVTVGRTGVDVGVGGRHAVLGPGWGSGIGLHAGNLDAVLASRPDLDRSSHLPSSRGHGRGRQCC